MVSAWTWMRRGFGFAPLAFLLLGGCVTGGDPSLKVRPVLAIERSGRAAGPQLAYAPAGGSVRVPQMKVIRVPQRPGSRPVWARLPDAAGAPFAMPVEDAVLTSTFGLRDHPILGGERAHEGVDLAAPAGTPVFAAAAGIVEAAGPNGGYGNYIRVRHDAALSTAYGHMRRFAPGMAPGAAVEQGQVIGYVGSTGRSTGPHLHWEVLVRGEPIDPLAVMPSAVRTALLRGSTLERSVAELSVGGR